jgi:hypothetical protein
MPKLRINQVSTYLNSRVIQIGIHIFSSSQTSVCNEHVSIFARLVFGAVNFSTTIGFSSGCSLLLRHMPLHKTFSGVSASIRQPLNKIETNGQRIFGLNIKRYCK